MSDKEIIGYVTDGLKPAIRAEMLVLNPQTLLDTIDAAKKIELKLQLQTTQTAATCVAASPIGSVLADMTEPPKDALLLQVVKSVEDLTKRMEKLQTRPKNNVRVPQNNSNRNYNNIRNYSNQRSDINNNVRNRSFRYTDYDPNVQCTYCTRRGHVSDDCRTRIRARELVRNSNQPRQNNAQGQPIQNTNQ